MLRLVVSHPAMPAEESAFGGVSFTPINGAWSGERKSDAEFESRIRLQLAAMNAEKDAAAVLAAPSACQRVTPAALAVQYAAWLRTLAEIAGMHGVLLLQTSGGPLVTAKTLWRLAESVDHPAFGFALDATDPSLEAPAVVVPTLGSRVHLLIPPRDTVEARPWLTRLMGIGSAAAVLCASAEQRAAVQQMISPARLHRRNNV